MLLADARAGTREAERLSVIIQAINELRRGEAADVAAPSRRELSRGAKLFLTHCQKAAALKLGGEHLVLVVRPLYVIEDRL
jgi:hypothetical protein